MSQQGRLVDIPSGMETLTGNTGGPVGPDGSGNIDVLGAAPISVAGNPGTNTLTIDTDGTLAITYTEDSGTATPAADNLNVLGDATQGSVTSGAGSTITITNSDATETQKGVSELATDAEAIAGADTERTIVPSSLAAKLGVQTANGVAYGAGTAAALAWTSAPTDGQLVIGATGAAPAAASLTSTGGTITVSAGTNTLNVDVDGSFSNSFVTDAGTATPAVGILTVAGGTLLNTAGAASTLTINADDTVVASVSTDGAAATPASNAFTIAGGTGCATSAAGATVTIDLDASIPASFPTDSGTATPAANALTIAGGTNINTSGAGSTVTANLDDTITLTRVNATTFDTNVAAAAVTLAGTTLAADGTDTNIDIEVTPKGTGVLLVAEIGNAADTAAIVISAAGEVTKPLQPTVVAYKSSDTANATGDGTAVTIVANTEVYDYNGDYDSTTGIYTAPVSGLNYANLLVTNGGVGASTSCLIDLITLNRTYRRVQNSGMVVGNMDTAGFTVYFTADMDAADTCYWQETVGGTTKTVSIRGTSGPLLTVCEFGLIN